MATSDKLPTFEQIWGAPAPTVIKAGPGFLSLMRAELAKPKRKTRKTRKPAKEAR
jgi:hypothetical protein